MCGVFGYVTDRDEALGPILIEAAQRLTYRGYGSVGAATFRDGTIARCPPSTSARRSTRRSPCSPAAPLPPLLSMPAGRPASSPASISSSTWHTARAEVRP